MVVPVEALRRNSTRKRKASAKNITMSTAKNPSKKTKIDKTKENKSIANDAIGKLLFDQLAGKGTAANTKKMLIKALPPVRGFGNITKDELNKLQSAVDRIGPDDKESKKSLTIHFRCMVNKAKAFGKLCTLKQSQGDGDPDEARQIDDYAWAIDGMASTLRHHQLIAAGIMIDMERQGKYSGGLLFDYMGYGKTVESLALIVGSPATKATTKDSVVGCTLVVVPTAAAQQWIGEITLHCPGLSRSLWVKAVDTNVITRSEVLVITYAQLRQLYKEALGVKKRPKEKTRKDGKEDPQPVLNHALFNTKFHRIVLDEMHEIKGYPNVTCDSVMALKSKYRWGMTGTPTPNGLEELFPYLKFIQHPDITTMCDFKKEYYVGGKACNSRTESDRFEKLRQLLSPVMIMRTPSHSLLGTTLLQLPKGHPMAPIRVKFCPEEKIIYTYIKENIQRHNEEKTARKGSKRGRHMVNESYTRHRQCVSSPLLLEKLAIEGFWSGDSVVSMRQEAQEAGCKTTPFIDQIERWILRSNLDRASTTPGFVMPPKSIADARAVLAAGTCPGTACDRTTEQLVKPQRAECGHIWCKVCLEHHFGFETMILRRANPECSRCHKPLGEASPFSPLKAGEAIGESMNREPIPKKQLGVDYNGKNLRGSDSTSSLDQGPTAKVPRSAKVDAVIRQIVAWQKEAPGDKIIGKYDSILHYY